MVVLLTGVYLLGDVGPVAVKGTFVDQAGANVSPEFNGTIPGPGADPVMWATVAGINGSVRGMYPAAKGVKVELNGAVRAWQQPIGVPMTVFKANPKLGSLLALPETALTATDVKALIATSLANYPTPSQIQEILSGRVTQANLDSYTLTATFQAFVDSQYTNTYLDGQLSDRYTRAQSDARYVQPSSLTPYLTSASFASSIAAYYTKTEAEARFVDGAELASSLTPYLTTLAFNAAIAAYYTKTQSDARYLQTGALTSYYTGAQTDSAISSAVAPYLTSASFASTIAGYYTKTQSDARYLQASALTPYYTSAQVDTLLGGYYTKSQVDALVAAAIPPVYLDMFGRSVTLSLGAAATIAGTSIPRTCKLVSGVLTMASASLAATLTIRKNAVALKTVNVSVSGGQAVYAIDFTTLTDAQRTCAQNDVVDVVAPGLALVLGSFNLGIATIKP